MITYRHFSLADTFSDCKEKFENDKYQFLSLLQNTIDLDDLVPASFKYSQELRDFCGFLKVPTIFIGHCYLF